MKSKCFVCGKTLSHRIAKYCKKHRPITEETKKKLRQAKKLKPSWNKGTKGVMVAWNKGKRHLAITGSKHPLWNGGSSKGYRKGYRDNLAYKQWRKEVFERDDYTCQECGITGVYLTAHHKKSFYQFPELRLVLENGLTLCEECHKETDNYKGRGIKSSKNTILR